MTVQVKASSAIEALCTKNMENQQEFLRLDAPKYLIRLLKVGIIIFLNNFSTSFHFRQLLPSQFF